MEHRPSTPSDGKGRGTSGQLRHGGRLGGGGLLGGELQKLRKLFMDHLLLDKRVNKKVFCSWNTKKKELVAALWVQRLEELISFLSIYLVYLSL